MKKSILLTIALIGCGAQAAQEDNLYIKNVSTKYIMHVTGNSRNSVPTTIQIQPGSANTLSSSYIPFSVTAQYMDSKKENGIQKFGKPSTISSSTLDKVRGKNNMALELNANLGSISANAKKK